MDRYYWGHAYKTSKKSWLGENEEKVTTSVRMLLGDSKTLTFETQSFDANYR